MKIDEILPKIRSKRQELNYSQEYVALLLPISQGSYNKIENGNTELTVKMLSDITTILGLEEAEFLEIK